MQELFRNKFYVFAVNVKHPSIGTKNLSAGYYYLYDGFRIDNKSIFVSKDRFEPSPYDLYLHNHETKINISAIVGHNGSGKSSLVEFMMRIINNLAAFLLGEYQTDYSSEHLHFIDGLNGELYALIERNIYRIVVKSHQVYIDEFKCTTYYDVENEYITYKYNGKLIDSEKSLIDNRPIQSTYKDLPTDVISQLFYTIISNSSHFAYNTQDFSAECNSSEYESIIRSSNRKTYSIEQRCWLSGILESNDSFQTPICILPKRNKGNIDINTVQEQAKESYLRNILLSKNNTITNDHLQVSHIELSNKHNYNINYIHKNIGYQQFTSDNISEMKKIILELWAQELGVTFSNMNRTWHRYAKNYLVCETLIIAEKCEVYRNFYDRYYIYAEPFDANDFKILVYDQMHNLSHETRNLRRTIAFLLYDIYKCEDDKKVEIESIFTKWDKINQHKWLDKNLIAHIEHDGLLPPPFLRTSLILQDIETCNKIDFETISSGEKQIIFSISSILAHLRKLNSIFENNHIDNSPSYHYINLILEEIELYYHPSMQKKLLKNLIDSIKQLEVKYIKGINICIVTHSPFVLSDIHSSNILALERGKCKDNIKTFGANIHEMLKQTFFMNEGTIGDIAQWTIKNIIKELHAYREGGEETHLTQHEIYRIIQQFEEPIIKKILQDEYCRTFPNDTEQLKLRRDELKRQLMIIESQIKE